MKIKLEQLCETLKLRGMGVVLNEVLISAEHEQQSLTHSLQLLLDAEYKYRQERSLINRVRLAKLPWDWTLASFPFEQQPNINKSQIMSLASLDFIHRLENIVFIGPPGAGKSGLAIGLLRAALVNGYHGRFYNAQDLLDELYASLADRSTGKLINTLSRYDVLVIDELGYLTLNTEQVNAFFKLMDMRYGRKATIITTNLEFEEWYDLFNNKPLVDALLDRLKHRCIVINIEGPSLRLTPANNEKTRSKKSKSLSAN
jgi:DNA replication protein DnaC